MKGQNHIKFNNTMQQIFSWAFGGKFYGYIVENSLGWSKNY